MVLKAAESNAVGAVRFLKRCCLSLRFCEFYNLVKLIVPSTSVYRLSFPPLCLRGCVLCACLVCVRAMVDDKLSSQWPTKDTTQA